VSVLELRAVAAGYGPFRALFGVSFQLGSGQALALVGPNGAGKTTVARVASGLVVPGDGQVLVDGVDLAGSRPSRFARAGVAHAPEGRSVFASLTVEENLVLSFREALGRRGVRRGLELAFEFFPVLRDRRRQPAGTLSGGEQRMLSLARVMVEEPRVLIADELSLGLAPIVLDKVYEALGRLRSVGIALLLVEQHVGRAMELCDRVALLDHGTIGWTGPSGDAGDRVRTQLHGVPPVLPPRSGGGRRPAGRRPVKPIPASAARPARGRCE
jgi:branched-chain amino acid transport system ATP-binding protein